MISFDELIVQNKIFKREKDNNLKNSLIEGAKERIKDANTGKSNPKYKFEQAYEALRELSDAFLAKDGYKTYSHEASLTYLKKMNLVNDAELERLDICRKKRNDSKYYGKNIDEEEAKYLIEFLKEIFTKIIKKL